jgi:uncharacterized protein (DUF362 family)
MTETQAPGPYEEKPTRREMVARVAAAAAASAAVGGGALFFHDRRRLEAAAPGIPDWRVARADAGPRAAAARGADPAANVRRAVAAVGGIEAFVKRGESVLVKPNAGWDRLPEQAANTDPRVVAELVRLCRGAGAKRVVVADLSVNDPARSMSRSGLLEAARSAGAEVLDGRSLKLVPASLAGSSAGLEVIDFLFSCQRVINVPVAKHHGLSRATVGMKNWFGVLGRGRNRLHQGIDRAIAELGATFRPTLTVVDATRVLLSNGPQGGSLNDVKAVNAVAAGIDPVLCDAWGIAQMGLDPKTFGYLVDAERRSLGRLDLSLLEELGAA